MSKTKNFQFGGGTFRPGQGVFDNQIKPWKSTSDKLTLKDLIDRPNYYLDKTAKYFNLSYNKLNDQKDPFFIDYNNEKGFKDPSNDNAGKIDEGVLHLHALLRGNLYGEILQSSRQYLEQYRSNFYQISYLEADGNEKLSRPVKYCYTAQEIQTIIDEDLVSGSSGFYVSKMGDLTEPRYGPFILQSKSKGLRNEIYIRPELQTDASFISGSMGGYRGDTNDYAVLDITYHKTGIQSIAVEGFGREVRNDITISLNFDSKVYDLSVGSVTNENKRTNIIDFFNKDQSNGGEYHGTGAIWEPANTMVIPTMIYKNQMTKSMNVHFDSILDDQDVEKEIQITNATPKIESKRIQQATLYEGGTIPSELFVDQGNYRNLFYHQYGAPFSFWGHKYDSFDFVRIRDSHQLKSFRIPGTHLSSMENCKSVILANCPNLDYIYFHPKSLPMVANFIVSGCGTDWLNDYHTTSPVNENHDTRFPWRHMFRTPPAHARCPYYNGLEVDLSRDEFYPNGTPPVFIANQNLKTLNLGSNKLNQTGIFIALKAAIYCNRLSGYFNAKGQETRNGPENALIYSGVHDYVTTEGKTIPFTGRPDAYLLSNTPTFEENAGYENAPVYDVNNHILTLVKRLEFKGWNVDLDYTDQKYNINGDERPNFTYVNSVADLIDSELGEGAAESMADRSYFYGGNKPFENSSSSSSSSDNSSSSYSSDD